MVFTTDTKVLLILVLLYGVSWISVSWFRRRKWIRVLAERLDAMQWDDEMAEWLMHDSELPGMWETSDFSGGATDQEES
jgi:hypothetical protein